MNTNGILHLHFKFIYFQQQQYSTTFFQIIIGNTQVLEHERDEV